MNSACTVQSQFNGSHLVLLAVSIFCLDWILHWSVSNITVSKQNIISLCPYFRSDADEDETSQVQKQAISYLVALTTHPAVVGDQQFHHSILKFLFAFAYFNIKRPIPDVVEVSVFVNSTWDAKLDMIPLNIFNSQRPWPVYLFFKYHFLEFLFVIHSKSIISKIETETETNCIGIYSKNFTDNNSTWDQSHGSYHQASAGLVHV